MGKYKTILIVDDDQDVKESTQVMLLNEGYDVVTASDGEVAVRQYEMNKPDITFMDLRMPKMDGYEAFFKIKETDPRAKIVFITAFEVDAKRIEEAEKKTLVATLHKPVELSEFLKVIEKNT